MIMIIFVIIFVLFIYFYFLKIVQVPWGYKLVSNLPVYRQFNLPHLPPPGISRGGGNLNKYKSKGGQMPPLPLCADAHAASHIPHVYQLLRQTLGLLWTKLFCALIASAAQMSQWPRSQPGGMQAGVVSAGLWWSDNPSSRI